MGATDQPRDTWGRWSARPGSRASVPERPTAASVFTEGTRSVYLTNEKTPHYQVWEGAELVAEKPAGVRWQRNRDEAIALARGVPRDTANLASLSTASHAAVINSILRGARGSTPAPSGIRLRSKGEIALSHLVAENMRHENPARSLTELRTQADSLAAQHAASGNTAMGDEMARQLSMKNARETQADDAVRAQETFL